MSHDRGWRAAGSLTMWSLGFHFGMDEEARGVTAMVVGSGALLALGPDSLKYLAKQTSLEIRNIDTVHFTDSSL